jgi:DNA-binding IclR family transcriptional regulator
VAALSVAIPSARFDRRQEPGLHAHLREVCTAAEREWRRLREP